MTDTVVAGKGTQAVLGDCVYSSDCQQAAPFVPGTFLAAVDCRIDRNWTPEDIPVHGVPPPFPYGVVYPPGEVDPSTIPDPSARTAYEQALAANRERSRRAEGAPRPGSSSGKWAATVSRHPATAPGPSPGPEDAVIVLSP